MTLKSSMSWSPWLGATLMGRKEASDYDDDAASEASSEALALAVATEEAVKEEEEAAKVPSQPRQGLTRLGSLLPRRAEPGQEGQPYAQPASIMTCTAHCLRAVPQLLLRQMRLSIAKHPPESESRPSAFWLRLLASSVLDKSSSVQRVCSYDHRSGEPRLPGAPSLSKSLGRLGSMLPRRRPDNAAQDASDDECDADAAFALKATTG